MKKSITSIIASNRKLILFVGVLLGAAALGFVAWQAGAQSNAPAAMRVMMYGVNRSNNRLVTFDASNPGTFLTNIQLTGLVPGEQVLGIDLRPKTLELNGIGTTGNQSWLLNINTTTGAVTNIGRGFTPAIPITAFAGLAFNPVTDQLRVTTFNNGNNGQSYRIDPVTGLVITIDTPLAFAPNDPLFGRTPLVDEIAFTNAFAGATQTTAYAVDDATGTFVLFNGNNGQLVTIGPMGIGQLVQSGDMMIDPISGLVWVSFNNKLYILDPTTGRASLVGTFPTGTQIDGVALAPPLNAPSLPFIVTGPDAGTPLDLRIFDPVGNLRTNILPFGASFQRGVRVSTGDINGDGSFDFWFGSGGGDSRVKVVSGMNAERKF